MNTEQALFKAFYQHIKTGLIMEFSFHAGEKIPKGPREHILLGIKQMNHVCSECLAEKERHEFAIA